MFSILFGIIVFFFQALGWFLMTILVILVFALLGFSALHILSSIFPKFARFASNWFNGFQK